MVLPIVEKMTNYRKNKSTSMIKDVENDVDFSDWLDAIHDQ